MEKVNCNIIRDLLPLYEDNVASRETQELIRTHLVDCLDCREELRKMRTPISLPPAEDREAVNRFLEYQAEVRRKQRRKIIRFVAITAAIVTVLIASLLWYTRPRSWVNISNSGEITRFSAHLNTYDGSTLRFKTYALDENDGLDAPGRQILALLEEAAYRVRPWDTLSYHFSGSYGETGTGGTTTIFLGWDQGQQAEYGYFILYGSGTLIMGQTVYTAKLDGVNLYKAITAVIQEYGTQNN